MGKQVGQPRKTPQRALPQARTGRVGQLRPVAGYLGTQALAGGAGQHHAPWVHMALCKVRQHAVHTPHGAPAHQAVVRAHDVT